MKDMQQWDSGGRSYELASLHCPFAQVAALETAKKSIQQWHGRKSFYWESFLKSSPCPLPLSSGCCVGDCQEEHSAVV